MERMIGFLGKILTHRRAAIAVGANAISDTATSTRAITRRISRSGTRRSGRGRPRSSGRSGIITMVPRRSAVSPLGAAQARIGADAVIHLAAAAWCSSPDKGGHGALGSCCAAAGHGAAGAAGGSRGGAWRSWSGRGCCAVGSNPVMKVKV